MQRSLDDLIRLAKEQLQFLASSVQEFEKGNYSEVKRLASTIRTLVHETSQSKSLILQIERNKEHTCPHRMVFFDKGGIPQSVLDSLGTPTVFIGCIIPMLPTKFLEDPDFYETFRVQNFREKWWERPIMANPESEKKVWSRKDIVLKLTNKEGGSHVDVKVPTDYLKAENSIKYHRKDEIIGITYHIIYEASLSLIQSLNYYIKDLEEKYIKK